MLEKWIIATALWCAVPGAAPAFGTLADVTIYDRTEGRALPVYSHGGRRYVAGKPGNEYQVRVRNGSGADILAVVSVDGVNVVSGETANWNQAGYVLRPHETLDIKGWRKNLQRVAAFFFTEHENSYASRTGRPDNVGVVGVALFRKRPEPAARIERELRSRAPARHSGKAGSGVIPRPAEAPGSPNEPGASAADSAAPRSVYVPGPETTLGTGHGRSERSVARHTSFERATETPEEVIVIHYDSYRNLVARGVIRGPQLAAPSPFPGQFVPDPW